MSLPALRLIDNISDPDRKGFQQSFYSLTKVDKPLGFLYDKVRVEYYPVVRPSVNSTLYFLPADGIPSDGLTLVIGEPDQPSSSGTASLNYNGDSTGLTAVSATVTESALQSLLNANPGVSGTGQTLAVQLLSTGNAILTWSGTGSKHLIEGDGTKLRPESVVSADWLQEGNADNPAIQYLKFLQRPFAAVESDEWTATSGPVATVETLRVGSGSAKAMFSVSIFPLPYGGSFTVKDSGALAANGSQQTWQTSIGTGWTLVKTGDASFTIERTANEVYTLGPDDINVTNLSVYSGFYATLNFNKAGLFQKFSTISEKAFDTDIQIKVSDGTNDLTTNYSQVTLHRSLIGSGALDPNNWDGGFYRKTESDARYPFKESGTANNLTLTGDTAIGGFTRHYSGDNAGGNPPATSAGVYIYTFDNGSIGAESIALINARRPTNGRVWKIENQGDGTLAFNAQNDAQDTNLAQILLRRDGTIIAPKNKRCVFEGDSITSNSGPAGATGGWAYQLMHLNLSLSMYNYDNIATPGDRVDQMRSQFSAQVTPLAPKSVYDECYYFLLGGTNDILQGRSAADIYADLNQMWTDAAGLGYLVIAFTVPYSSNFSSGQLTVWNALNALIVAGTSYHKLVDLASMSIPLDDGTHPTIAGHALIAAQVNATLFGIFTKEAQLSNVPASVTVSSGTMILPETGTALTYNGASQTVSDLSGGFPGNVYQLVNVGSNTLTFSGTSPINTRGGSSLAIGPNEGCSIVQIGATELTVF